ncbi:hypothetical protein [Syntrophobotulus glycolicus]|uniref:hypothetical protein n=1 Tax=Syntrophobotulus glycolicus TaxID=51197 RepID=UPI0002E3545D|nr:hypothetical protein [Syntrophobotulus glycolicus]
MPEEARDQQNIKNWRDENGMGYVPKWNRQILICTLCRTKDNAGTGQWLNLAQEVFQVQF